MRPRILHVAQPTDGGVARYVADLAEDQLRRGWGVAVAAPDHGSFLVSLSAGGADTYPWPATRDPGGAVPGETRRLWAIVRRTNPDLVHLHSAKAGLAGRLAVRGRMPTVFQPHAWSFRAVGGTVARAALSWERLGARWADKIVCVSDAERAVGASLGIRRLVVIRNGVDITYWRPPAPDERAAAKRATGAGELATVVCVGRLTRQKGQDVLLEAWRSVAGSARLVLVGDGPDRDTLEDSAPEGVVFAGASEAVREWLWAADLVVLPSRWEGLSLSLLEAMACGRPVVATDVEGATEVLGASRVVPADDPAALAREMERLLGDESLLSQRAAEARRTVESGYDLRRTHDGVADLYRQLLAQA